MKRGKHSSKRIKLFVNARGRHAKDELIVYNPIYAKFSACVSSFAVTTSLLTCLSFGKYKETLATSDVTRASKFLLNIESTQTSVTEFIPETTRSFSFTVSNFEGTIDSPGEKNEVALRYMLNIDFTKAINLPLEYKLYRIVDGAEQEVNLENLKTEWMLVNKLTEVHQYKLDITWRKDETDSKYQQLTDKINISIEFEQTDNI